MKSCSKCKEEKPPSGFHKDKYRSDGLTNQCAACRSENDKRYNREKREKKRKYMRQWHADNPHMKMWYGAKYRAEERGLEFTIEPEDVEIPDVCPVLGIEIDSDAGKRTHNSPSLDRIDNELGYTPENTAVISWRANCLKRDGTLEEFKQITQWLNRKRKMKNVNIEDFV